MFDMSILDRTNNEEIVGTRVVRLRLLLEAHEEREAKGDLLNNQSQHSRNLCRGIHEQLHPLRFLTFTIHVIRT